MSKEIFEIVQGMDPKNIETQLAIQCAPLIAGLKISNLLIIQKACLRRIKRILRDTGISYCILLVTEEKATLLLYDEAQMQEYLLKQVISDFLKQMGYQSCLLEEVLAEFGNRYRKYRRKEILFPHEMGLLLGYPMEDVKGFIQNQGRNFLHTGYWKVYENLAEKLRLFQQFETAQKTVVKLVSRGVELKDIIEAYQCGSNCAVF
ncbi:MAG: DUF3793 family protein [Lachnospiraceae bacterium]|nr:DUF3793 family protein [Lachnospiraceae bacterium]